MNSLNSWLLRSLFVLEYVMTSREMSSKARLEALFGEALSDLAENDDLDPKVRVKARKLELFLTGKKNGDKEEKEDTVDESFDALDLLN